MVVTERNLIHRFLHPLIAPPPVAPGPENDGGRVSGLGSVMNLSSYPIFRRAHQFRPPELQKRDSQIHEQFPEDGEHDSLASIRNDPRLQSTTEQPQPSIRSHDGFGSSKVSNVVFVNLAVRLDDAQGV